MSLAYSHPEDLHKMVKDSNRKLSTIIELLTLLSEQNEQQINTQKSTTITDRFTRNSNNEE